MTTDSPELRVGTWNVLSFADEYDADFGCPLSIAICPNDDTSNLSGYRSAFTQQRQQRIWNRIESLYDALDVLCLQEVQEDFLSLHNTSASHWTMVQQSTECAIFISKAAVFHLKTSYNVTNIPNLSGCASVPIVVLLPPSYNASWSDASPSYLIGSVHVQASVTDMDAWYQSAWDAIYKSTIALEDWRPANPVWVILAGDFNHNLTAPSNGTRWTQVAVGNESLLPGTTQKEYNYMGNVDGFLISSAPLFNVSQKDATLLRLEASNVSCHLEGFMPKVVQGFLQGNVVQEAAQFSLAWIKDEENLTQFWNESQLQDFAMNRSSNDTPSLLQLLFSESSSFVSSDLVQVVPNSNPFSQALSDHLLVTATFGVVPVNTRDDAPTPAFAHKKSESKILLPLEWAGLAVVVTIVFFVAWRMWSQWCVSSGRTTVDRRSARFDPLSQCELSRCVMRE
jgi:Endonuclease/Exonuclease/phosphatase family